jgi:hypothetical protein
MKCVFGIIEAGKNKTYSTFFERFKLHMEKVILFAI